MLKLHSIDLQVLQDFQSLYKKNWPMYCQEYYILSNFIMFKEVEPELKHINAYTLADQQAQELGLFVIMVFIKCLS